MAVPAFATEARPHEKVSVCHYEDGAGPDGILEDDLSTLGVNESADNTRIGWYEISINRHAVGKQVANHVELMGVGYIDDQGDFEIGVGGNQELCNGLISSED